MTAEGDGPGREREYPAGSLRLQRTEQTRAAILAAGRELFTEPGYGTVGTEEIARRAQVTRGALYHHFEGKEGLFRAVVEDLNTSVAQRIASLALAHTDAIEQLRAGAGAFLDACLEPTIQRVLLIDAPAVLGWETWRAMDAQAGLGLVELVLATGMDVGRITRQPVSPLAHVLVGALDEAALVVGRSANVSRARREMGQVIDTLLRGLEPAAS